MFSSKVARAALAGISVSLLLTGCERPPVDAGQIGYRGTGMEQVVNPRTEAKLV